MTRRYALSDDQWDRIKDLLPGRQGHVGVTARDNRLFVDAVLYRYRAGIPRGDLPERFGDFRVVHTRHSRWSKTGVWQRVFEHLAQDADNEYAIESTPPSCEPTSTVLGPKRGQQEQAIGRSRGGLSTKIHATTDALGNPTGFHLTPGQAHDLEGADALLPAVTADAVIADKAYDAQARVIDVLTQAGQVAVIPPIRSRIEQRSWDRDLYKARHLIENFFTKLKQYRAIATCYDKTARNFLGAIHLAASVIWLN